MNPSVFSPTLSPDPSSTLTTEPVQEFTEDCQSTSAMLTEQILGRKFYVLIAHHSYLFCFLENLWLVFDETHLLASVFLSLSWLTRCNSVLYFSEDLDRGEANAWTEYAILNHCPRHILIFLIYIFLVKLKHD